MMQMPQAYSAAPPQAAQPPVSPELMALMTLMQGAQKGTVRPQTNPQDGAPPAKTVAAGLMETAGVQALQQRGQQEASRQGGIAAGIGMQKQQEQQQLVQQLAQQMQQQKQQQPLLGGVAQAPGAGAGMRFAGGGIVGFAGDDESYVDAADGGMPFGGDMALAQRWREKKKREEAAQAEQERVRLMRMNAQTDPRSFMYGVNPLETERAANMAIVNEGSIPAPSPPPPASPKPPTTGVASPPRIAGQPVAPTPPLKFDASRTDAASAAGDAVLSSYPTKPASEADVISQTRERTAARDEYLRSLGLPPEIERLGAEDAERKALYEQQKALYDKRIGDARRQQGGLSALTAFLRGAGRRPYGTTGQVISGAADEMERVGSGHEARARSYEDAQYALTKLRLEEKSLLEKARHAAAIGDIEKTRALTKEVDDNRRKQIELQTQFGANKLQAAQALDTAQYRGGIDTAIAQGHDRTQIQVANINAASRGAGGAGGDKKPIDTAMDNAKQYAEALVKSNPMLSMRPGEAERVYKQAFNEMFAKNLEALVAIGKLGRTEADAAIKAVGAAPNSGGAPNDPLGLRR